MFLNITEKDKYGINQKHYTLTQGDSCAIVSTPKDSEGEIVSVELISKCMFRIMDEECLLYKIIFEKEMTLYDTYKFIFNFLKAESELIPVGKHFYEIEYAFVDGGLNTTNLWKFDIIKQGIEEAT